MEGQAEAASEGDSDTRRGSPAVATAPAPPRTAAAPVDVLPPRAEEERSLLHSAPVQHVSSSTWYAMDVQGSDDGRPSPRKPLGFVTAGLPRSSDPLLRHSALQAGTLPGGITARERLYMVTLFTATASLLYADQNLMAPNLSSIAADFNFDDKQRDRMLGGFIAAAFYMVGAPAALLFGWLSDKVSRKRLLFAAVMLGEGPCILTIFVHHYWELLILRLLTGIALGGALPVVFSLLGDLYDPSRRAGVSSIVQLSTGIGLAMGQGIAGFVGPALGWRWPFVIVSLPAIAVSFLMLFTCREPLRGGTEAALQEQFQEHPEGFVYREVMTWRKLGHLLVIPTNALVIMQGLFGCLPWGMILVFLNDFLAQNKGLSVQQSTFVLLVLGVGGGIGVVGGGWLGQWLYNRWKWSMSLFIGSATVVGTLPLAYLVNADVAAHPPLTLFMALMAGLLSGTVGPNMRAMILNVNEPETRGTALALQTMLDDLGKGLGPVFVAAFIEKLGRVGAFNISTAGWIPCGLLLLGTSVSLARDEKAMQQRLRHVLGSYSYTFSSSTLLSDSEQQRASGQPAEHCTRVAGTGDSSSSHRLSAPDVRGGTSMQHRPGAKAP